MTNGTKARLAGYTTLAATGMMAEPADAAIITSTGQGFVPVALSPGQAPVSIDFGPGVGTVFRFAAVTFTTFSGAPVTTYGVPIADVVLQTGGAAGGQSALGSFAIGDPYRLPAGYLVSAGNPYFVPVSAAGPTNTFNDVAGAGGGSWNSIFGQPVTGFLGVRFDLPDGTHYGFFELRYDNDPTFLNGTLTVLGWAYEDVADRGLATFSLSPVAAVPEPASLSAAGLGLLACGAAGLRRRRAARRADARPTPAAPPRSACFAPA